MTYFGFLGSFVGPPLILLVILTWWERCRGRRAPFFLRGGLPGSWVLLLHVVAAVVWTTPWDNYLVATGVWYYDQRLVTGITLGWVPIEEYTFFVTQTLLTGMWLLFMARRGVLAAGGRDMGQIIPCRRPPSRNIFAAAVAGVIWLTSVVILVAAWKPGAYLGLELGWLLLPVILQLLVGADLLWRQRRLVAASLLPPTVYLAIADSVAIHSGTWAISPAYSTGLLLGATLPIEEAVFFLLTNTLIVFGMVLLFSTDLRRHYT